MPRSALPPKARQFLALRGLDHWAERAVSGLSQGQRQHVCWRADGDGPDVLFLD